MPELIGKTKMANSRPSGWSYRLSPHLVLHTHHNWNRVNHKEQVLVVQSGKAFPPGHPTTRLCLDLLREVVTAKSVRNLLDVGCGAGVIGLAAAGLGVPVVVGVDIAWAAARAMQKNVRSNDLAGSVRVAQGSTECVTESFDLVVANLPWEVQREKVSELDRLVSAEGSLILSGFRDNQEDLLLESYQKLGRSLTRRIVWEFSHPELPGDMSFTWVAWLINKP